MIDLLALMTIVLIAPPDPCDQAKVFEPVTVASYSYAYAKPDGTYGVTKHKACIPRNASSQKVWILNLPIGIKND